MPITITQALDLPVAVVLIMFIPLGLWRGALREWVACAGIALGALLGDAAGVRWGEGFGQLFHTDAKLGGFTIGAALFLASVLLIGYGSGLALPYRPDLSWTNRALGALIGLGNGFLIVGGLLRLMQTRLFDNRSTSPLHTAALVTFLIDASVAWVYLGFFLILLVCVGLGLARRINGGAPLLEEYSPIYQVTSQGDWASAARWQPQTPVADTSSSDTAANVAKAPEQQTQALRLVTAPVATTTEQPQNGQMQPPVSASPPTPKIANVDRPTARPTSSPAASRGSREPITNPIPMVIESPQQPGSPTLIPRPTTDTRPRQRDVNTQETPLPTTSCPICNAPLADGAHFCGNCGHITGAAERRQIARQR